MKDKFHKLFIKITGYDYYLNTILWARKVLPFLEKYSLAASMDRKEVIKCFDCDPFRHGILGLVISREDYQMNAEDILAALLISSSDSREFVSQFSAAFVMLIEDFFDHFKKDRWIKMADKPDTEVLLQIVDAYKRDSSFEAYRHYFSLLDSKEGAVIIVSTNYDNTKEIEVHISEEGIAPDGFSLMRCDYCYKDGHKQVQAITRKSGRNYIFTDKAPNYSKGKIIWRH